MSSTRASGFFMREDYAPAPVQTEERVCGITRKSTISINTFVLSMFFIPQTSLASS